MLTVLALGVGSPGHPRLITVLAGGSPSQGGPLA